jgi:hypothetical protein
MKRLSPTDRPILVALVVVSIILIVLGCSTQEDPFLPSIVTPTAVPPPTTEPASSDQSAEPAVENTPVSVQPTPGLREIDYTNIADRDVVDAEIVRFAEWDDKDVQLGNAVLAYITFHGLRYRAEVVQVSDGDYQAALANGSVDVVLQVPSGDAAWLAEQSEADAVVDVGSIFSDTSDIRIAVHSGLSDRSPEVIDVLTRVGVSKELFSKRAATISGGRLGIKPTVAAQAFFKRNEAVWKAWVPNEVSDLVLAAIADGRVSYEPKTCSDGNQFTC